MRTAVYLARDYDAGTEQNNELSTQIGDTCGAIGTEHLPADGNGREYMRLSYCYPTPERIREGVRRLVGVIEEEMELRETFGTSFHPTLRRGYEAPNTDLT